MRRKSNLSDREAGCSGFSVDRHGGQRVFEQTSLSSGRRGIAEEHSSSTIVYSSTFALQVRVCGGYKAGATGLQLYDAKR